ncbi:hypothetical protein MHLNE_07150 [Moorella humiferrea]
MKQYYTGALDKHKHTKHKKEVLCSYENTLADVLAVINNHLCGK